MANTVNRNYPLTGINDAPDGPQAIQRLAEAVDTDVEALENELRTVPPFGHMGRVGGFQTMAGTGNIVAMSAAQALEGGMTFDDASDSLVIPKSGRYRLTIKGMGTGSSGTTCWAKCQLNLADLAGSYVNTWKADAGDVHFGLTVTKRFLAGDKINLINGSGNGNTSTWGTNGYDGTFLELSYESA